MRAEIIVFLIVFIVSGMVLDWACLVMAADADRRAEEAAKELEKEKQKREPRIVMLEGECEVRTLQPDSAKIAEEELEKERKRKTEEENERKE